MHNQKVEEGIIRNRVGKRGREEKSWLPDDFFSLRMKWRGTHKFKDLTGPVNRREHLCSLTLALCFLLRVVIVLSGQSLSQRQQSIKSFLKFQHCHCFHLDQCRILHILAEWSEVGPSTLHVISTLYNTYNLTHWLLSMYYLANFQSHYQLLIREWSS